MTRGPSYIAAPPGELYWRYEICPSTDSKVLLKTIGGTCIVGQWQGAYGFAFVAWCPLPKGGKPPAPFRIEAATLWVRIRFAVKLIFQPAQLRNHP